MSGTRVLLQSVGSWIALALVLAMAPAAARAEGFFDIYAGAAFPQDGNVRVKADDAFWNAPRSAVPPGAQYTSDVEWETSPSFGLRGGYWFEFEDFAPSFLGIGLDLSYYRAFEKDDFASLDMWFLPITPLLMLRIPLGYSEEFPGGRVQPYAAVGPGFTLAAAHAELSDLSSTGNVLDDFNDATLDVGLDVRAGLAVQLSHSFALFGEYRYTYIKPNFKDEVDDTGAVDFDTRFDIDPKVATHHLVIGASFRF
jgi:opacity protein-like surface antigen